MATLTAETNVVAEWAGYGQGIPCVMATSATVYKGAFVCFNTSGLIAAAVNTTNFVVAGTAMQTVVTATAGQTVDVEPLADYIVCDFTGTATQGDVGEAAMLYDDTSVTRVSSTTYKVRVGTIVQVLSATRVVVDTRRSIDAIHGYATA